MKDNDYVRYLHDSDYVEAIEWNLTYFAFCNSGNL